MAPHSQWSKDAYDASVSSRCWNYTAYGAGWDGSKELGFPLGEDDELREIVEMERSLGRVPDWAAEIVEKAINDPPPCGHYRFPEQYREIVAAIGAETAPRRVHCCYTVERGRKRDFQDYGLCLDAWLAGAAPEGPARELNALGHRRIDWPRVCRDLWQVLGDHTELKDLLIERVLHQTRWWVETAVWEDDPASEFGRDQYLGHYSEAGCLAAANGTSGIPAPAFRQETSPRIQRQEARLAAICPDWTWFRTVIVDYSWPCAPKAFRYLEKLLWCISKERPVISLPSFPLPNPESVPGFLQIEDTIPNAAAALTWWRSFLAALTAWWQEAPADGPAAGEVYEALGSPTPVKRWLVRLLVRKLQVHERDGAIRKLFDLARETDSRDVSGPGSSDHVS